MVQQTSLDTGIIYIKSHPPGAEVFLNGDFYSQTPLRLEAVEPGVHEYLLRMPGYQDYKGDIYVESGKVSPEFAIMSANQSMLNNKSMQSLNTPYKIQSLQTTIPQSEHGYTVVSDSSIMIGLGIALAVTIGILLGKYLFKRD